MIFKCFVKGITPVSTLGTLVNAIVAFEMNGISGPVSNLNRILPDKDVSSALTSIGAPTAVKKRRVSPGGVDLGLRLVASEATGCE